MILYKKMSLFDAPEGSILAHGCNARGIWGGGIAATFRKKYPKSYVQYNTYCLEYLKTHPKYGAVGTALITREENKRFVGCLITSANYGAKVDDPEIIVAQTYLALDNLFKDSMVCVYKTPIYCNKFNSGLFQVPWHETEKALKYFINRYKIQVTVCDPDYP